MKKFGFGKKKEDVQENPYSQAPSDNPYAQQPASDPYANAPPRQSPYQQARSTLPSGPRPGGGLPSGPGPARGGYNTPPPPYASGNQGDSGYTNEKLGASGGYGGNRYDNESAYNSNQRTSAAPQRQGGYGGLGDTEAQRDDLFSGAKVRQQQQPPQFGNDDRYGASGASATSGGGSYGGYGDQRELTEEEREAQEVQDVKQQIKQTKQESLASTQRSLAIMNQAIETGTSSLARLGAQGDRLYNTERNLNKASVYNREAERKTSELKTLNRSMFAVHVANPFTKNSRAQADEDKRSAEYQADKAQREAVQRDIYSSNQRMEATFKKLNDSRATRSGPNANERSKYQFFDDDEDQDEDNRLEDEIDANVDAMSNGLGTLKMLGQAMSTEMDEQNKQLSKMAIQTEEVDNHIMRNNNRLAKFK